MTNRILLTLVDLFVAYILLLAVQARLTAAQRSASSLDVLRELLTRDAERHLETAREWKSYLVLVAVQAQWDFRTVLEYLGQLIVKEAEKYREFVPLMKQVFNMAWKHACDSVVEYFSTLNDVNQVTFVRVLVIVTVLCLMIILIYSWKKAGRGAEQEQHSNQEPAASEWNAEEQALTEQHWDASAEAQLFREQEQHASFVEAFPARESTIIPRTPVRSRNATEFSGAYTI